MPRVQPPATGETEAAETPAAASATAATPTVTAIENSIDATLELGAVRHVAIMRIIWIVHRSPNFFLKKK